MWRLFSLGICRWPWGRYTVPSTSPARDAWRGEGWWAPASFHSESVVGRGAVVQCVLLHRPVTLGVGRVMGSCQIIGGLVVLALNHTDSEVPYSPSLMVPLLIKLSYFIRYLVAVLVVGRCRRSLLLVTGVSLCRWSLSLVTVAGLCRWSLS